MPGGLREWVLWLVACSSARALATSIGATGDVVALIQHGQQTQRAELGTDPSTYFLHIPRTGGTSFLKDASRLIWGIRMTTKEGCFAWKDRIPGVTRVATMLRSPRAHVASQHLYCAEGDIAWMTKMPSLPDWLAAWADLQARGAVVGDFSAGGHDQLRNQKYVTFTALPYKCYNPANLQTQHLTCDRPFRYPAQVDVDKALRNMRSTWFVGITEAYQESLCLFHAKVQGTLPAFCNCADQAEWSTFKQTHTSRHASGAGDRNASRSPALLAAADALTAADRKLYAAAVERFVREIRVAEADFGVQILCSETAALLTHEAEGTSD